MVAFLFQRSGKQKLDDNDIYKTLSYELGWFTPSQSRSFIKDCLGKELLKEKGGGYMPNFDYERMEIPLGFKVDGSMIDRKNTGNGRADVLSFIVSEIEEKGVDRNVADEMIKKLAENRKIIPEVAALVIARKYDLDTVPFLRDVWDIIKDM